MQFREPVTGDRGDRPRLAILAQRACCIGSTLGSLSFVRPPEHAGSRKQTVPIVGARSNHYSNRRPVPDIVAAMRKIALQILCIVRCGSYMKCTPRDPLGLLTASL
ncbi:hypothetical protein AFLA_003260 [Aspergillus flavus NRRL3357]|nr:hypothetical protein AFLA_003260 [Aspergillus flavus NRRL3357]